MAKIGIFMAEGCEEIEALTVVDVLRRGKMDVTMISISDKKQVTGSHSVSFDTDALIDEVDFTEYDGVVLPGGMPGTTHLGENKLVVETTKSFAAEGKLVAAICAAPSVLGQNGILIGKKAISYPEFEDKLTGAEITMKPVVVDGNIITSRGMGTAIEFALEIFAYYYDEKQARALGEKFIYDQFRKG